MKTFLGLLLLLPSTQVKAFDGQTVPKYEIKSEITKVPPPQTQVVQISEIGSKARLLWQRLFNKDGSPKGFADADAAAITTEFDTVVRQYVSYLNANGISEVEHSDRPFHGLLLTSRYLQPIMASGHRTILAYGFQAYGEIDRILTEIHVSAVLYAHARNSLADKLYKQLEQNPRALEKDHF